MDNLKKESDTEEGFGSATMGTSLKDFGVKTKRRGDTVLRHLMEQFCTESLKLTENNKS